MFSMSELQEQSKDFPDGNIVLHKNIGYTPIENNIIFDRDIDFYTLGVYSRLLYLIQTNQEQDDLYSLGKPDYIERALEKLEKKGYIKEQ